MSRLRLAVLTMACVLAASGTAYGVRESNVRLTEHNLSSSGTGSIKATSETQVCVFCHTPHGATAGTPPLWNRKMSTATYTGFTSDSMDAVIVQAGYSGVPGGSSKLCLSCHDGTLAIGSVNMLNTSYSSTGSTTIAMTDTGGNAGKMPVGVGLDTGYTPAFGTSLNADHPISVDYTTALATKDNELNSPDANQRWPAASTNPNIIVGIRDTITRPGDRPKLPLEKTGTGGVGQIQCATCHDAHIRETDATKGNQKFLRNNRFQEAAAAPAYSSANDQTCLACHEKDNGATGAWAYSAHGNSLVATQTYTAAAAARREFPTNASYNKVWNAACLNCHDAHTVQTTQSGGKLLREGSDGAMTGANYGAGGYRAGGNRAEENTCYQCHTVNTSSALASSLLIDIEGEIKGTGVGAANNLSHPVGMASGSGDLHSIGGTFDDSAVGGSAANCSGTNGCGADGMESRARLGVSALTQRHAECTDCHNPHRIVKEQIISAAINDAGYVAGGAHRHENTTGWVHDNIASGVLRGTWGVEPNYTSNSFHTMPSTFTVKRGDPGTTPSTAVTSTYVTREYQVCLKCHSNYGYADDNVYPSSSNRPQLGGTRLTPSNPNGRTSFSSYTNQAKEFNAPTGHRGGSGAGDTPTTMNSGNDGGAGMPTTTAATAYCTTANATRCNNNNHRSWHPVIGSTGRVSYGAYYPPWGNAGARGTQTMYCTDCHGTVSASVTSVIPDNRSPTAAHTTTSEGWGPHGGQYTANSTAFMLKGLWSQTTAYSSVTSTTNVLCFKCHCPNAYVNVTNGAGCVNGTSGVSGFASGNAAHKGRSDHYNVPCQYCHVAIVHGWKNKTFLVNLNDIGPEAGSSVTTSAPTTATYNKGPYYGNAGLRIVNFGTSGNWSQGNCNRYNNSH